jgi:hypothetical protein
MLPPVNGKEVNDWRPEVLVSGAFGQQIQIVTYTNIVLFNNLGMTRK